MLRIQLHPDGSEQLPEALVATLETLAMAFDGVRSDQGVAPLTSLEIVVSDDLAGAVREFDSAVIGDESKENFHTDRVGGVVVGKTMYRDEEHRQPVLVMSRGSIDVSTPINHAHTTFLVAHELAHTLIGQMRHEAGVRTPPAEVPWETCKWLARYAFEEYRADSIADVILGATASVTEEDGGSRPMTVRDAHFGANEFGELAATALRRIVGRIHEYRVSGKELSEMWLDVQTTTGEILIALAHGQAAHDGPRNAADPITSESDFGPMHSCWKTLHELFHSEPIVPAVDEFADQERALVEAAGTAILEFWKGIGLTFRDDSDPFYIEVAPPALCWC